MLKVSDPIGTLSLSGNPNQYLIRNGNIDLSYNIVINYGNFSDNFIENYGPVVDKLDYCSFIIPKETTNVKISGKIKIKLRVKPYMSLIYIPSLTLRVYYRINNSYTSRILNVYRITQEGEITIDDDYQTSFLDSKIEIFQIYIEGNDIQKMEIIESGPFSITIESS